ncbi:hypothetical protein NQ314_020391 [Rhamnusium bicolor]|uniref:Uncharacterized protein n=1 Tax=Rhamnusium bicolor TaxID=1586634 RepID=A0AAV8WL60_9CUCU|nr:hypothetical protein NQ314_020391 [Rhamnusium bicolor]
MELQKGVCFLCRDGKVIKSSQAEKAFKIISSLFSKKILNTAEFNNIQSSLKLCPICYHKLVIMKHTNENIKTDNFKDDVHNKCLLCKSKQLSFKINDWPHFGKISDDLVSKDEDAYIVCSECLFYLDTRHHIKTKLFSKYPQLKVKPPTENEAKRRKSKYRSEVKSDSAVVSVSRRRLVRGIINISSDEDVESPKKQSLKLDFLKKLKPLRHSESFRRQQIVKSDSKFLKQIPYVLLETSNFSSERINNKNILNEIDDKETPVHKIHKKNDIKNSKSRKSGIPEIKTNCSTTKIKPRRLCPKSIKIKRELRKHDVGKRLVVNLSKVDILQHSRNYKPDLEIENLIDKFNVLQRPTTGITGRIPEESSKDNFNGLLKETESNVEVKAKRKSVSFAEDKNVEIEYFQNDSKPNSIDSFEESTKNDSTEEMLKKQNKDIDSSESANKTIKTQKRTLGEEHEINSTDSEVGMESEIEFDESPRVSNTNIINNDNVSNADLIDNDDENVGDEKTIKDKIVEDTELDSDTHKKYVSKLEGNLLTRITKILQKNVTNLW